MPVTPLLDQINYPSDLKQLKKEQLTALAKELREELIDAVSVTGGLQIIRCFAGGLGPI